MFSNIKPTSQEIHAQLPGDEIVPKADVVMDRAFTLLAPPKEVWPWLMQLGKNRAGWYFPASIEHVIFPKKRALRRIEPSLQTLEVGDIIDDWGGRDATFELAMLEPTRHLVYKSQRGRMNASWAIILEPQAGAGTRVHLRLRLAPVRQKWLADSGGGLIDALTVAGLAAGLRERLASK